MDVIVDGNKVTYEGKKFGEIDLYYPEEDWMGIQLDYTRFDESQGDNPDYGRRFGVGGLEFHQYTPDCFDVYRRDLESSSGEETYLFSWFSNQDQTEIETDGDISISAEFAWRLCEQIEKYFADR